MSCAITSELTATTRSDAFRSLVKRTDVGILARQVEETLSPESAPGAVTRTAHSTEKVRA
jgi:hypothetical protein